MRPILLVGEKRTMRELFTEVERISGISGPHRQVLFALASLAAMERGVG